VYTIGSGKTGLVDGKFSDATFFRPQGVSWKDDFILLQTQKTMHYEK
jgi:hypothetical protein